MHWIRTIFVDDRLGLQKHSTKSRRDAGEVANSLEKLKRAAVAGDNTMPATIEAVRAYATLGEICDALRDVYGLYEEPAF